MKKLLIAVYVVFLMGSFAVAQARPEVLETVIESVNGEPS